MNTSATPSDLSSATSSAGIVPPTITTTSSTTLLLEQRHYPRHECHVRTRQDREPDRIGILLDDRFDDLLGRLMQARVDHLHARIAQRAGDDLCTAVVTVKPRLGDNNADLLLGGGWHRLTQAQVSHRTAVRDCMSTRKIVTGGYVHQRIRQRGPRRGRAAASLSRSLTPVSASGPLARTRTR